MNFEGPPPMWLMTLTLIVGQSLIVCYAFSFRTMWERYNMRDRLRDRWTVILRRVWRNKATHDHTSNKP